MKNIDAATDTQSNASVFFIREQTDSSWIVQHREGQQYCIHNHEPAPPGTFPEHRQLTRDQTALIETNYASGIPASRTIAVLRREDPSITEPRHDRQACRGCRSTGHIRSNCPHVPRAMPVLSVLNTAPSATSTVADVRALGEQEENGER